MADIIPIAPEGQESENVVSDNPQLTNKEAKSKLRDKYSKEIDKLHRNFKKDYYQNYKDPEEDDSQIIDLSQLQDPPDDFKIVNLDARHPEMADGFALVVHHFWNINPQIFPRNSRDRIRLFRKLAYNQDEQFRPRDLRELSDLSRDAGPRLLKPEILRRLGKLPISRHYPEYKEDADWEEQRTRPIRLPEHEASGGNTGDGGGDGPDALALEETPPNLNLIRECLERLFIQLRYRQLEVVDAKRGEELFHALIDTSESSRRRRLPLRKVPLTLDNSHNVEKAFGGFTQPEYPSRERGPACTEFESASNSKFDCLMMVGKFLDAGITKIDVEKLHSHGEQETNAHRNFVNMIQADWKPGNGTRSEEARRYFHRLLNDLQARDFRDLVFKSTLLRAQFSHTVSRTIQCDNDHDMPSLSNTATASLIFFDGPYIKEDGTGVTMQEVLQSFFPQEEPPQVYGKMENHACTVKACEGNPKKTIIRRSMPLRMAVSLSSQVSPLKHTSNDIRVKFNNDAKGGAEDVAVYHWIGGVYANTKIEESMTRYRVYWTDSLRGGKPSETISIYDPLQAGGQVIEGVFPASQNEPVPPGWWHNRFKPVIFYERVFNPDWLDITLAAAILGDMKHASDNNQYILQIHDPQWNLSQPPDDQSVDHVTSKPPGHNTPSNSGDASGSLIPQSVTGYAGAAFETQLKNLDSKDVQMQDDNDYNEPSQPPNDFSQNIGKLGVGVAGYNLKQSVRSMPPPTQPPPENHGMFRAFNSDMSQVAPDQPRTLLTEHYGQTATTNASISDFARRDLGQRSQFIPMQSSHIQDLNFAPQSIQINSQHKSIASGNINSGLIKPVNTLNQAGNSNIDNEYISPVPDIDYNEYLRMTPQMSNLNSSLPATQEGHEGQAPDVEKSDTLFDFDDIMVEIPQ